MTEVPSNSSPDQSWKRYLPTLVIPVILGLIVLLSNGAFQDYSLQWVRGAFNWSREQNNAGAVQAISAILQILLTGLLLALTWHATNTSRDIARDAQRQATRDAERARHWEMQARSDARKQAVLATLPVLAFRHLNTRVGPFAEVRFNLTNVGMGPAVLTRVELSDLVVPYEMDFAGQAVTLRPGEGVEINLVMAYEDQDFELVAAQAANANGWYHLATLTTRCQDVRGNRWENGDELMLDAAKRTVLFGNPRHNLPWRESPHDDCLRTLNA